MKSNISDKDILQLFTGLKDAENNYPQNMIEARRDTFAKQAAAMAILAKAGGNGGTSTGTGEATSTAVSGGATGAGGVSMAAVLEMALAIAIVAEAGFAAYVYREKIAEFIKSTFSPKAEETAGPLEESITNIPTNDNGLVETPNTIATVIATETPVPAATLFPAPGDIDNNSNGNDESSSAEEQIASTPAPNDNPGNHYGNTPKPERTKEKEDKENPNKDKKK